MSTNDPASSGASTPPQANADRRSASERTTLEQEAYEVIARCYDVGEILDVRQVFGGYVNLSFMVTVQGDDGPRKYFLRKYNPINTENEIGFELSLLEHLSAHGFCISAGVIRNAAACPFECTQNEGGSDCYWSLYDFLEGENKYTWVDNQLTEHEYAGAGRLLAQFHAAAADFDPGHYCREQPPILDLVAALPRIWRDCVAGDKGTVADQFLLGRFNDVLAYVQSIEFPPADLPQMPRVPVHCDYHPGNLKYSGEEICGLFDFDWSKIDYRLFDVAEGCVYFCSSWRPEEQGALWIDSAATFVAAYQEEALMHRSPGPLTAAELRNFVRMLACANLYVLNWDITAWYGPGDLDPDEYLTYLRHNVLLMDFIRAHEEEIELRIVAPAAAVAAP